MRPGTRLLVLATVGAGAVGAGGALALGQGGAGVGSAGTGTAGPGTIVTPTAIAPAPTRPPVGTAAEQTHPSVLPATGGRRTRFTVRLTLADAPGHTGVFATSYRLQIGMPASRAVARCPPPAPPSIDSGAAHQVVRLALSPPAAGWCSGRYDVTVFLQRGPYCPRPAAGQPPAPCPAFAQRDLAVGTAYFSVGAKR